MRSWRPERVSRQPLRSLPANLAIKKAKCYREWGCDDCVFWLLLAPGLLWPDRTALGQIDPEPRKLFQFGYNQPLEGASPIAGYMFYYLNDPNFLRTNVTLRLAIAPVYLDSEFGFGGALGPNTDLGLGLAGGGFADSYYEFRDGTFLPSNSFTGHSAEVSGSIYHLFNPGRMIPLNGILRLKEHFSIYDEDSTTSPRFVLPHDHSTVSFLTGLRWGGREPLMRPDLAMELSAGTRASSAPIPALTDTTATGRWSSSHS